MIPGVNPRQLKQMMKQMGMSQDDIEASEVIIKTNGQSFVFKNPGVQKVTMQGQTTFQISGDFKIVEQKAEIQISDDDIEMVSNQANVSKAIAKETLEKVNGDIAEAIITLENN